MGATFFPLVFFGQNQACVLLAWCFLSRGLGIAKVDLRRLPRKHHLAWDPLILATLLMGEPFLAYRLSQEFLIYLQMDRFMDQPFLLRPPRLQVEERSQRSAFYILGSKVHYQTPGR